jgi:4-hydroxy-tetrahydrodipicolinate reductase
MKIALLGYGKMGKVIEKILLQRGHEIVLRKSSSTSFDGLLIADVAIDFSLPNVAVENISECLNSSYFWHNRLVGQLSRNGAALQSKKRCFYLWVKFQFGCKFVF